MRGVVKILGATVLAAYPLAIWAGISMAGSRTAGLIALGALIIVLPSRIRASPELLAGGIALVVLVLLSVALDDPRFLLALPVLMNLTLLAGFGVSLLDGRVPIAERFARMTNEDLSADRERYCRSVTRVWCGFFLANACVSLALALFSSLAVWALYNGAIAYGLMGTIFVGEYAIRKIRFG